MRNSIRFFVKTAVKLALQIKVFRDIYEQWQENIKSAHREDLENIKSAHREDLENIKSAHRSAHREDLENIKSAHREDLENIKSAHREDLENIKSTHTLKYPAEIESIERISGNKISILYKKKPNLLSELFDQYGSDKGYIEVGGHPYPWHPHNYSDFYSILFGSQRESIKKVFECGIGTNDINLASNMTSNGKPGASLRAWRDFFPNAIIYGADIDTKILFEEDRIKTFFIDQTSAQSIQNCWNEISEKDFDIILDDGLHTFEAGITLFVNSINKLGAMGSYIIEDVGLADLLKYEVFFRERDFIVEYVSLNDRNRNQLGDNSLVVIKKPQK